MSLQCLYCAAVTCCTEGVVLNTYVLIDSYFLGKTEAQMSMTEAQMMTNETSDDGTPPPSKSYCLKDEFF